MGARHDERGNTTANALGLAAAVIGLLTALLAFVPALRPWTGDEAGGSSAVHSLQDEVGQARRPADVTLDVERGPVGTVVHVSGEGFSPGEVVDLRLHATTVGRATANDAGIIAGVPVTVPDDGSFRPGQYDVVATGRTSVKTARAPFVVTD